MGTKRRSRPRSGFCFIPAVDKPRYLSCILTLADFISDIFLCLASHRAAVAYHKDRGEDFGWLSHRRTKTCARNEHRSLPRWKFESIFERDFRIIFTEIVQRFCSHCVCRWKSTNIYISKQFINVVYLKFLKFQQLLYYFNNVSLGFLKFLCQNISNTWRKFQDIQLK